MQDANVKLIVDGTDSWCEFYVTHNSRYVLSSGKVTLQNAENPNKKVKVKKVKITGEKSAPAGSKIRLQVKVTPKNATNKDVKWKSSNTKVATVNAKGVVTLKKNSGGKTVTITATAKDGSGKKDTIKIKSEKKRAKVKSIKISGKTKMKAGKTQKLKATVKVQGNAPKKVKWSVDNKKYATVSANGTVKAKKEGKGKTIRVTAKAMDGSNVKATFRIKIK
ncbi:Ig-like domain-containing protein [Parablautia sp. Marseille-Q6255]|uniref:Ig-like domain-containing protein n=1 Tax=Parablautia sp. Marseille-Q6255 TaxID=3039593 RepID=UPI0024BC7EDB|nr:Ig-like domain-containing protein [Parablautia sp. Marseille-Q6255]